LVGNDIVDLNQALKESNWKRKGYLEKIFTADERFLISSAKDPEMMVWLLWTMKESVYKVYTRETKIRTFAPAELCCNNLIVHKKTATGNVQHQDETYFTQSTLEKKYIHTIAALEVAVFDSIKLKISRHDPSDSSYRSTNPISVSHHGNYLALAYL
jgi:phosphopantetheinyl transferase (holo-ACP synthase)